MNEEEFKNIEKIIVDFKDEIKQEFRHQLGIQTEKFQHKLDIVVEGHQMLSDKMDRIKTELVERIGCVEHKLDIVAAKTDDTAARCDSISDKLDAVAAKTDETSVRLDLISDKLDNVAAKIDVVAADLTAHRADTEIHHMVYKIKEEG